MYTGAGAAAEQSPCIEKHRLVNEYNNAVIVFGEIVKEMHTHLGTVSMTEYDRLRDARDVARMKSEQAKVAFEEHVAAHGC